MKAKEIELRECPSDKIADEIVGLTLDCAMWGAKICINKDCESMFPRNREGCPFCLTKQELDEGTKKHKALLDDFLK